jgi:hypothetical protein
MIALIVHLSCYQASNTITCSAKYCNDDDTAPIVTGTSDLSEPAAELEPLDTGSWPSGNWVAIEAGGWHTCAIDQEKETHCWGRNNEGQAAPPELPFRALAAGHRFTCGLGLDSMVTCWGEKPINMPEGRRFLSIKAGRDFLCGIDEDNDFYCWGAFEEGQTDGAELSVNGVLDYALGNAHGCLLDLDGKIECWGRNTEGQATLSEEITSDSYLAVSAGFYHSCALSTEERVVCWGTDYEGSTNVPPVLAGGLWSGYHHNCIINPVEQALCWGGESYGLSGGLTGASFSRLTLGGFHSCGITVEDELKCYGDDTQGQLEPFPVADTASSDEEESNSGCSP